MERPWQKNYPQNVRQHLDYPEIPLQALLDRAAQKAPDQVAMVMMQHQFTYAQTYGMANKVANLLVSLGVKKGDRVALYLPNCPQYIFSYFGILKAGAVVASANPLYVEREIEDLINNAGAEVIICADVFYPRVKAIVQNTPLKHVLVSRLMGGAELGSEARSFEESAMAAPATPTGIAVGPRDLACFQYTGGTTGVSKGAILTHGNLVANVYQILEYLGRQNAQPGEETILTVLPLYHSYAMTCCMNFGVAIAAKLVLLPRFDLTQVLEAIRDHKVTSFPGVPTMYVAVNAHPQATEYGINNIRLCNSGAAPLPIEVMTAFEKKTGAAIVEGYGLSETSPVTHVNPIEGKRKPGSVGLPMPDTDVKICDVDDGNKILGIGERGEICLKGPQVFQGYWQMPDETKIALRDGWLYTGDIGYVDDEGYLYIVDRKKDMIIAGGFNIYPRDVEEVLYTHPAVQEACVAGAPDEYRGETVKAYVVRRAGATVSEADLDAFCRQNLAAFKVPRIYEFRDSLPKSPIGKILRRVLVEEERAKRA